MPLYEKTKEKESTKLELEKFTRKEVLEDLKNEEIYKYFVQNFEQVVTEGALRKACASLKALF